MASSSTPSSSPAPPARRAIWLDCDPGHDDALAIVLAGWSPAVRLLGVSTVHGNAPLAATTRNALTVLNFSS